MMQYHQLKLQQNDFGNLYPTPCIKLFIHSCGHARPQGRGATNAVSSLPYKVTQLGLYVMSAHLGIKKDIRALLQHNMHKDWNYM